MRQEFIAQTNFVTEKEIEHHVAISPEWEVFVDGEEEKRFSGEAAILVGGFIMSVGLEKRGTVHSYVGFYKTADDFYNKTIKREIAQPISGLPEKINGTSFNKYLTRMTTPVSSPFRSNIERVNVDALKKRLLICQDMSDIEKIIQVIMSSQIADDVNNIKANDKYKRNLITSIQTSRGLPILLPEELRTQDSVSIRRKIKPSDDTRDYLNRKLVETSTSASRGDNREKVLHRKDNPEPSPKEPIKKVSRLRQEQYATGWMPSEEIIGRVGKYVFDMPEDRVFTERELIENFRIAHKDVEVVFSVFSALLRAGFVVLEGKEFRRTDKQKDV